MQILKNAVLILCTACVATLTLAAFPAGAATVWIYNDSNTCASILVQTELNGETQDKWKGDLEPGKQRAVGFDRTYYVDVEARMKRHDCRGDELQFIRVTERSHTPLGNAQATIKTVGNKYLIYWGR